jgi:Flp pilus assembly protein TadD
VLRIDRDFPGAHARLGELLLRRGRRNKAVGHLLAELKTSGGDPTMLQEIGQLLIEARHTRYANSVLRRLVRLTPQDAQAHHNLAVTFFLLQRLEDGIRHCRKALKIRPDYPLALYNLALAHMQQGSVSRARRYISRAITLAPGDERICRLSRRLGGAGLLMRLRKRLGPRCGRRGLPD